MSGRFHDFCEETGRDYRAYSNIDLFEEFADWVRERANDSFETTLCHWAGCRECRPEQP